MFPSAHLQVITQTCNPGLLGTIKDETTKHSKCYDYDFQKKTLLFKLSIWSAKCNNEVSLGHGIPGIRKIANWPQLENSWPESNCFGRYEKNRGLQLLASALDASRPILHHRLWLEQFRPFRSSVLWLPSGFITSAWSAHRSRKIGSSGCLSWFERKRLVWLTVVSLMRTRSANNSTFHGQCLQDVTKEIRNRSSWELTRQTVLLHLSPYILHQ